MHATPLPNMLLAKMMLVIFLGSNPCTSSEAATAREELVWDVFSAIDADCDGTLSESEMYPFARSLAYGGSSPGDACEWSATFERLCVESGWPTPCSVDLVHFTQFVNEGVDTQHVIVTAL